MLEWRWVYYIDTLKYSTYVPFEISFKILSCFNIIISLTLKNKVEKTDGEKERQLKYNRRKLLRDKKFPTTKKNGGNFFQSTLATNQTKM